MRALEPLVPRAFGEQLAVEGLLAVWADNHLRIHIPITREPHFWFRQKAVPGLPARPSTSGDEATAATKFAAPRKGEDSVAFLDHSESGISAAMRLDPNTHALVMATAFMTSICFAVAAMSVIGLTIHLFVPGAG